MIVSRALYMSFFLTACQVFARNEDEQANCLSMGSVGLGVLSLNNKGLRSLEGIGARRDMVELHVRGNFLSNFEGGSERSVKKVL